MTLEDIISDKQRFVEKYMAAAGCSDELIDVAMKSVRWAAVESWHQGKIDYIKDDLSGVLTEIKKGL